MRRRRDVDEKTMNEGERKTLQQSLRETWMGALGVLSGAEHEMARAAQRMLESMGLREGGEHTVKDAVRDLVERVRKNRDVLERRVDEGVKAAVARVHRPLQHEVDLIRGRIEQVQKRLEELASRR